MTLTLLCDVLAHDGDANLSGLVFRESDGTEWVAMVAPWPGLILNPAAIVGIERLVDYRQADGSGNRWQGSLIALNRFAAVFASQHEPLSQAYLRNDADSMLKILDAASATPPFDTYRDLIRLFLDPTIGPSRINEEEMRRQAFECNRQTAPTSRSNVPPASATGEKRSTGPAGWAWLAACIAIPLGWLCPGSFVAFPAVVLWLLVSGKNSENILADYGTLAPGADGWFAYQFSTITSGFCLAASVLATSAFARSRVFRYDYLLLAAALGLALSAIPSMFDTADPVTYFTDSIDRVSIGMPVAELNLERDDFGQFVRASLSGQSGHLYITTCREKVSDLKFVAAFYPKPLPDVNGDIVVVLDPTSISAEYFKTIGADVTSDGWVFNRNHSGADANSTFQEYRKGRTVRGLENACRGISGLPMCSVTLQTVNRVSCKPY